MKANNWRRGPGGAAKTGKPEGPYLSLEEVAAKLGGVNIATVKQRIREAGIRPVRPGRTPYLHEDDIQELIEATRDRRFDWGGARAQRLRRARRAARALVEERSSAIDIGAAARRPHLPPAKTKGGQPNDG